MMKIDWIFGMYMALFGFIVGLLLAAIIILF